MTILALQEHCTLPSLAGGRYHVLRSLSSTGSAFEVLVALDTRSERQVVLKSVNVSHIPAHTYLTVASMLEREAEFMDELADARVARLLSTFYEANGLYLVIEFLAGESLYERIERQRGHFSLNSVLEIGRSVAGILDMLHTRDIPIIHRDIKPGNIMVTSHGLVFIDFGNARKEGVSGACRAMGGSLTLVNTDTFPGIGSRGFAPPEAYITTRCPGGTTTKSDIFSLGAILHQLVSGENPADQEKRDVFSFSSLRRCATIPPTLAQLVEDMVQYHAHARPSAVIVQHRLEQIGTYLALEAGLHSSLSAEALSLR